MLSWGLIIALVAILLFILLFMTLGDGLLKEAAQTMGVDGESYSVIPDSRAALYGGGSSKHRPAYVPEKAHFVELHKGFDINLMGKAELPKGGVIPTVIGGVYAVKMADFVAMAAMPKVLPEIGSHVKAGDALFFDKTQPEIVYAAPVSGILLDVVRGDKRAITAVLIQADEAQVYRHFNLPDLATVSREDLVDFLLESGAWALMRQRPYDTVANPAQVAKAIFISTFDTAPLAPNLDFALQGNETAFAKGLEVLTKLTTGGVHLGLNANGDAATAYGDIHVKGVEHHWFKGQHPAGNVGVQIHHVSPINAGEAVWYLDVHAVITLGKLFNLGVFDTAKVIAVAGADLAAPTYMRVHQGVAIETLALQFKGDATNVRYVSGDALSGTKTSADSHLAFYDDQITVLQEGNYAEIFGWLLPQKGHPTISRTFPGGFFPDAQYEADTQTNGEKRAFVMSGQYESVLPMDILPQFLFRAIMSNDLEAMEGLGLLELSEEDVAVCEYVCTSKQPLQQMLREGLDYFREQSK
jgi:Na+-transporting NADH:ubiquinone oxidoreductase subunit A